MVRSKLSVGALVVWASLPIVGGAQSVTTGALVDVDGSAQGLLPIEIQADHLYYGGNIGDVRAEGQVDLTQGTMALSASKVLGNTKTGWYNIPNMFTFKDTQPVFVDLKGQSLRLHQNPLLVDAKSVEGYVDPLYVKAKVLHYDGDEAKAQSAWVTTKHAMAWKNPPDYRVEGSEVKLDFKTHKIYVKDASFFIRNYKIITLPSVRGHFGNSGRHSSSVFSFLPIPSLSVDEGFGLSGKIDYPIGDKDDVYFHYRYFTKAGFKPSVGIKHYEPWGVADFGFSRVSNTLYGDTVWIEKRPELSVMTKAFPVWGDKVTAQVAVSAGQWREGPVQGGHYLMHVHFARKPIAYGKWQFTPFVGYQKDWYGYNNTTRSMPYWGLDTKYSANEGLNFDLGYRHASIKGSVSPYSFDTVETPERIHAAVSYQLTRLDRVIVSGDYNIGTHHWDYLDYTWHRNMHSFEGYFTYHQRQKRFEYRIKALDF